MDKLKEVIAYLIKNYPHKTELSNARLTKMVYLSDWHQAINYKKQITDIKWYFDNYGPFVQDVAEKVSEYPLLFAKKPTSNMFGAPKTLFELSDGKYEPKLLDTEKQSLDHVMDVTRRLVWKDFINLVYSTYPITSSSRYSFLDLPQKAREYSLQKIAH